MSVEKEGFSTIRSFGRAFNTGMSVGLGKGLSAKKGIGAMVGLGLTGAAIGGATGALAPGVDPVPSAAVGATIGATALPASGLVMGGIGTVGVGAGKLGVNLASAVGKGAVAASPYIAGTAAVEASRVGRKVFDFSSKLVNWDSDADALSKVKFTNPLSGFRAGAERGRAAAKATNSGKIGTKLKEAGGAANGLLINGATVITAASIAQGTAKAWGTLKNAKMGQMTGTVGIAPRTPAYADNAGATGDLVFAMNANRRG